MGTTYDSIILAGVSVGIVVLTESELKWSPRHEGDGSPKEVPLAEVLRSSWAPIGKSNHLRLFLKSGERLRFDGFRRTDIDGLSSFFSDKVILARPVTGLPLYYFTLASGYFRTSSLKRRRSLQVATTLGPWHLKVPGPWS